MSKQKKATVEDDIMSSDLHENMQKAHLEFCCFLNDNAFLTQPEADGNGWQIFSGNRLIGHMNFNREFMGYPAAIWIDTCDFGGDDSASAALKEATWAHVRVCEHYSSGGKQCGCGRQPGLNRTVFGREYHHLCTTLLEFMDPDVTTLKDIAKLLLLFKGNGSDLQ